MSSERARLGDARQAEGERFFEERRRVRRRPRTGAKICSIIAVALLAVAVYFVFAPLYMQTGDGWFGCGAVVSGPQDDFASSVCGSATSVNLAKSLLSAALAVIVGGMGWYLFGFDTEVQTQRFPVRLDEEDDDEY